MHNPLWLQRCAPTLSPTPLLAFPNDTLPTKLSSRMALIRNLTSNCFLRHHCFLTVPLSKSHVTSLPRFNSTVSSGRVKLDVQESGNFDSSKKELPMNFYMNRNPRSAELLGVAEKPRGFITTKRRVDYYHR